MAYINSEPELFSVEKGGVFDQAGLEPGGEFDMSCAKLGYFSSYIGKGGGVALLLILLLEKVADL